VEIEGKQEALRIPECGIRRSGEMVLAQLALDEVMLYYEESGLGDPFVFQAHEHRGWLFEIAYFSAFFRVVTFDRRGTGRSSNPPGRWTMKSFSNDMKQLLDKLGIEKTIIAGHSLGGKIGQLFTLEHPERVSALVLSGSTYYVNDLLNQWYDEGIRFVEKGGSISEFLARQSRFPFEKEAPPTTNPEFSSSSIGRFLANLPKGGVGEGDAGLKMLRAGKEWDFRPYVPEYRKMKCPVLIMVGSQESQAVIEASFELSRLIPKSEFRIVHGAYHGLPRENPEKYCHIVRDFLERHGFWPQAA